MKQLLTIAAFAVAVLLAAPLSAQENSNKARKKMKKEPVTASMVQNEGGTSMPLAITPSYSANFSIGSRALSKIVIDLYKMYETNQSPDRSMFADTLMASFTDGQSLKGYEQVMNALGNFREKMSDVKVEIIAVTPLRENKNGDDWVLVWGNLMYNMDGPVANNFHSLWRFNKDGKVDTMHIFERKILQQ